MIIFSAIFMIAGALFYIAAPQLSFDSPGLCFFVLLVAIALGINQAVRNDANGKSSITPLVPAFALGLVYLIGVLASTPMLRATSYYQLLGEERTSDFNTTRRNSPSVHGGDIRRQT